MTTPIASVDRYRVNDALRTLCNDFGVVFNDLGRRSPALQEVAEEELGELTSETVEFLDRWRHTRTARLRRLRSRLQDLASLHRFAGEQGLHLGDAPTPIRLTDPQRHLERAAVLEQRVIQLDLVATDERGHHLVDAVSTRKSETLAERVYDALIGAGKRALADEFVEGWEAVKAGAPGNALGLAVEYSPGHISPKYGVFAESGRIAPGYVNQFRAEGGEVLARLVGPYREVTDDVAEKKEGES